MTYEAAEIIRLLGNFPGTFISHAEIARRVDRRRFEKERSWARQILRSMADEGILEQDGSGGFRLAMPPEEERREDEKLQKSSGR